MLRPKIIKKLSTNRLVNIWLDAKQAKLRLVFKLENKFDMGMKK